MLNRISTDSFNWILLIGVSLLFIELIFFKSGLVFALFFLGFITYIGKKNYHHLLGKILFWLGIISIFFNVISMIAIRFFVIAAIVLFFIHYKRSKEEPEVIKPSMSSNYANMSLLSSDEPLIKRKSLFQNTFFGNLETSETPYQWKDINIHGGIGDRVIDLSNTVLPDEPIISIRHMIGNITIYVPYEVEVHIHHSSVIGRATFFGRRHRSLMNEILIYETENYRENVPRVKIITSLLSGDIEVKRV